MRKQPIMLVDTVADSPRMMALNQMRPEIQIWANVYFDLCFTPSKLFT